MSLDQSVSLVMYAFENAISGDIFVQKSPSADIITLANAIKTITSSKSPISIIGTRHGEKIYETLVAKEEACKAIDLGGYFRIPPDNRSLHYEKYFSEGNLEVDTYSEYNSHNTTQLDLQETINCLLTLPEFTQYR